METIEVIELHKHGSSKEAFRFANRPKPVLKEGELLVEVSSFGLNYADVMARNGLYASAPPMPSVLGYEVVGLVVEKHPSCKDFQLGDRVLAFTLFGAYAKHAVAKVETTVILPEEIEDGVATALATQYCTAYYSAIHMANIQAGETLLVHAAAGGLGTALVQLAKWKNCKVIGTASSEKKLEYLKSQGVDLAINYKSKDYQKEISSHKEMVDVSFNPIGGKTFKKDKALLSFGGRMVLLGVSTWSHKKGSTIDKLKLAYDFGLMHPIELLLKSIGVIGVNMLHVAQSKPQVIKQCMTELIALYQAGAIWPHINNVYSQSQFMDAHDALESRSTMGKLVVQWKE